ncbi:SPOR domain-containing protein [Pelagibaculum spongiae]|uniref:SPOR domain-containing protein n=1 Tax=Pelagibaculum spongiae TaxID=2080658 RepID=A0A2V1GX31_9GAMM|nr:SPOR domain-containing protein [Pelagibaculum spongiae]PVZ65766.1 hypothetical protein DC094_18015 [Pelagibaculum spongiae]
MMRWLGLLLIIAVLAIPAAWFYQQKTLLSGLEYPTQVRVDAAQRDRFEKQVYANSDKLKGYLDESEYSLELVKEAPSLAELEAPSMFDKSQAPGTECFWLGHFYEVRVPSQEQKRLPIEGITTQVIDQQKDLFEGWWIYVDGFLDRTDAAEYSEFLNLNGISSFTEPAAAEDDPTYRVSLGLYARKKQAQREIERLRKYGIDAKVAPRSRPYKVYGLRILQDTTVSPKNAPWKQRLEKKYIGTFKKIAC